MTFQDHEVFVSQFCQELRDVTFSYLLNSRSNSVIALAALRLMFKLFLFLGSEGLATIRTWSTLFSRFLLVVLSNGIERVSLSAETLEGQIRIIHLIKIVYVYKTFDFA